jgi:hypothetical protein
LPEAEETVREYVRMFGNKARIVRYVFVGITSGLLFGIMDGLINANPIAERLYEFNLPIRRTSVDVIAGVAIDLAYGFILMAVFLILYRSLPGRVGLVKGVSFALLVWFLRVVMCDASQWIILNVPVAALLYGVLTGLGEMLVLGVLYGATLRPSA